MSLESKYRQLISGDLQGPFAASLRGGLSLLEQPYRLAIHRRNLRFDAGHIQPYKVPAPVISVGNLTVGGTGKTPFVAWLVRWLAERGQATTIISRGYGSQNGRPNDEALELALEFPATPHLQNRDRIAAAKQAIQSNPHQVLILDDAFQHRRLARDLDIVLLDALAPFGFDHLLPRGLLREPIKGLARAQVVALSRSDAVDQARREEIRSRVQAFAPQAAWLELIHQPRRFVAANGDELPLDALRGQEIAAFCGIGNPAGFRHALASTGANIIAWQELPDHCHYNPQVLGRLESWLQTATCTHAICTRKDLVKIPRAALGGKGLWALEIGAAIIHGQETLEQLLDARVSRESHAG